MHHDDESPLDIERLVADARPAIDSVTQIKIAFEAGCASAKRGCHATLRERLGRVGC